jgi:hypothetical protein
MTAVKIAGTFKKDSRPDNGLESIAGELVKDEMARHVVVGIVELHKVTKEPGEAPTPTIHFVAIEPVTGEAEDLARTFLNDARKARGLGLMSETLFNGPVERDDDGVPYDSPERVLARMRAGVVPAACGQCGIIICFDPAGDDWRDVEGLLAADGHQHAPAEAQDGDR